MLNIGTKVRDKVTKYEGVVTAVTHYLDATSRVLVQSTSLDKDGDIRAGEWIDVGRLEPAE